MYIYDIYIYKYDSMIYMCMYVCFVCTYLTYIHTYIYIYTRIISIYIYNIYMYMYKEAFPSHQVPPDHLLNFRIHKPSTSASKILALWHRSNIASWVGA